MQRTQTSTLQQLSLPLPEAVTFDFSRAPLLQVTIPATSTFHFKTHWHYAQVDVSRGICVQGKLVVSKHNFQDDRSLLLAGGRGMEFEFATEEFIGFGPADSKIDTVMEVVANENLHRNLCSAVLDRDIYPRLNTTPIWIKFVFLLARWGALRRILLAVALHIQLQIMYYAHDYNLKHGSIDFVSAWSIANCVIFGRAPPKWTILWTDKSTRFISKGVMCTYYWIGRLVMGMKAEYVEYTRQG